MSNIGSNQLLSRALMRVGEWLQQIAHLNIFKQVE
jgi:hypothetical protein